VGAIASGFLIEWLGARRSAVVLGAWLVGLAIIVRYAGTANRKACRQYERTSFRFAGAAFAAPFVV
jgi:hypothetical protein